MFQNPEKEPLIPDVVIFRAHDMREAVMLGREIIKDHYSVDAKPSALSMQAEELQAAQPSFRLIHGEGQQEPSETAARPDLRLIHGEQVTSLHAEQARNQIVAAYDQQPAQKIDFEAGGDYVKEVA